MKRWSVLTPNMRVFVEADYFKVHDTGVLAFRCWPKGNEPYPEPVHVFAPGRWFEVEPRAPVKVPSPDWLTVPLRALETTIRAEHALLNANITTVGQLVTYSASDLRRIPNLGRKTLADIEEALREKGLYLAVVERGWP